MFKWNETNRNKKIYVHDIIAQRVRERSFKSYEQKYLMKTARKNKLAQFVNVYYLIAGRILYVYVV